MTYLIKYHVKGKTVLVNVKARRQSEALYRAAKMADMTVGMFKNFVINVTPGI